MAISGEDIICFVNALFYAALRISVAVHKRWL